MNVLIFNCGSSSQAFKVYQLQQNNDYLQLAEGKASNVATKSIYSSMMSWMICEASGSKILNLPDHRVAAKNILKLLFDNGIGIDIIGHRFVHGGDLFDQTTKIELDILKRLEECQKFAPIHNPNSLDVVKVCMKLLPDVPQFVSFDTLFHKDMPLSSKLYAIPSELTEKYSFRKYGFHGLSYRYISDRTSQILARPLASIKLIICHLGTGGSSIVAIMNGKSIDTSMGYSPLPGLVMSTRCGDIDAEIVLELIRNGNTAEEVGNLLNHQSGLLGLSGFSSNLHEIIEEAEKGNERCAEAYEVYAYRLKTYLGAYTWVLNGADAIIFTDEIGTNSWKLREKVCSGVQNLGIIIDNKINKSAPRDMATCVSHHSSKTQIWVIPTDEESVILKEIISLILP